MAFRLPEDRIPESEPWKNRDLLWYCYHDRGWSARTIAYELNVKTARVAVYLNMLGISKPWTDKDTLHRLYVEEGLTSEEIATRPEMDCSVTTVRKYLAEFGLIDEEVTYEYFEDLGDEGT